MREGGDFDFQYTHVAADPACPEQCRGVRPAKRAAPDECVRGYMISIQFKIVNLVAKQEGKAVDFCQHLRVPHVDKLVGKDATIASGPR